jgi:integrase
VGCGSTRSRRRRSSGTRRRSAARPSAAGGWERRASTRRSRPLEAVLASAVRYRLIERNPVDGFRVPGRSYRAAHLTSAAQIAALLHAAGERDRSGRLRCGHGRELLATLVFAGLRIDEALTLRWRDVDLANGALRVRGGKTENAARTVYLLAPLRDELAGLKARRGGERDALVFGTSAGGKDSASNVRRRVLAPAVEGANRRLDEAGEERVPERLTPHGLRHTFASILFAIGEDPRYVMGQLGHADAGFTLRVYAKEMDRRDGERERLCALVGAEGGLRGASPALEEIRTGRQATGGW